MRKRVPQYVYTLLALVLPLTAAEVTGKWTAAIPGRSGNTQKVTFQLEAEGDKLTGAVSTGQGETEIKDGRISGDEVSFMTVREINGNELKVKYEGKVAGKEIHFRRIAEGRAPASGVEFVAKKEDSGKEGGRPKRQ